MLFLQAADVYIDQADCFERQARNKRRLAQIAQDLSGLAVGSAVSEATLWREQGRQQLIGPEQSN